MSQTTYQVTAKVTGSNPGVETVGVYIIGTPTLAAGSPDDTDRDGSKAMGGRINQVLPKAFSAHVTDGGGNNVPRGCRHGFRQFREVAATPVGIWCLIPFLLMDVR